MHGAPPNDLGFSIIMTVTVIINENMMTGVLHKLVLGLSFRHYIYFTGDASDGC